MANKRKESEEQREGRRYCWSEGGKIKRRDK